MLGVAKIVSTGNLPVELLPHLDIGSFEQSLVAVFDLSFHVVLILLHRDFLEL